MSVRRIVAAALADYCNRWNEHERASTNYCISWEPSSQISVGYDVDVIQQSESFRTTATDISPKSIWQHHHVCEPTAECGASCNKKRATEVVMPLERLLTLRHESFEKPQTLSNRLLPELDGSIDTWMADMFASNAVLGSGAGGTSLIDNSNPAEEPTSRWDAFGNTAFSAGTNGLEAYIMP